MKVAFYSTHAFEKEFFLQASHDHRHSITYLETRLDRLTAPLATGHDCVCCFASDAVDSETLKVFKGLGVRLIALRSAGFNNVDLAAAERLGLPVVRVPGYSPYAVAEHAVALILSLDRKIHKAFERTRELNFNLDGLVGFDLHGKTIGIIGTGKIGAVMARIMNGFGCEVLAHDPFPNPELLRTGLARYVPLAELYRKSDVISLHVPLLPETRHMIHADALGAMKPGVFLINTGRGALIDTHALIAALKTGHIGAAGLDVYEEEDGIFFQNLSDKPLQDDLLARLLTFPNVLITSHQAFLTREALTNIAKTTLQNITDFEKGRPLVNAVRAV